MLWLTLPRSHETGFLAREESAPIRRIHVICGLFLLFCILWTADLARGQKRGSMTATIFEGSVPHQPRNTATTRGKKWIWNFDNKPYTIIVQIGIEEYNTLTNTNLYKRYDTANLTAASVAPLNPLAGTFKEFAVSQGWTAEEEIGFALAAVQALTYSKDQTTGYDEFPKFAVETLIEGQGDCEDTSILLGALAKGMGYKAALIHVPGHMALGIDGDFPSAPRVLRFGRERFYYCETTGLGWKVGQIPEGIDIARGEMIPIPETAPRPGKPGPVKPRPVRITDPPGPGPTPVVPSPPVGPEPGAVALRSRNWPRTIGLWLGGVLIFVAIYGMYRSLR